VNETRSTLHFILALSAGMLTGASGLGIAYILTHAYGVPVPKESPIAMTLALVTIAATLAILNWREDFNAMLDGEQPLMQHTVFRVWCAVFVLWFAVVVTGSVNARHLQGEAWYQHMPGALIFYIVPTLLWLHMTRLLVKTRFLKRESHVRAS
jgi:hypothetical protein